MDLELSVTLMDALGADKAAEVAVVFMQEELGRLSDLRLLSDGEWEILRSRCNLTVEQLQQLRQAVAEAQHAQQYAKTQQQAETPELSQTSGTDIDMSVCLIQALGEEQAAKTAVVLAKEGLYDLALLAQVSDADWSELRLYTGLTVGQMMQLKREVEGALFARRAAELHEVGQSNERTQRLPWWSKITCLPRALPPGKAERAVRPGAATSRSKLVPPWGRSRNEATAEAQTWAPGGSRDDELESFGDVNFEAFAARSPPADARVASAGGLRDGTVEL